MLRNRWVRRLAVVAVVGFVATVTLTLYLRYEARRAGVERLAVVTARLDATDPRWRLDDIEADREPLPDDRNSALLVPKLKAALAGKEFGAVRPGPTRRGVFDDLPPNRALDDEGAEVLDRALAGNDIALSYTRAFKDYPRGHRRYTYSPDFIGTLLPDLQETLWAVGMLDAEAERLIRDGRPGAALELVRAMTNAARSLDGELFLVSCLVRVACDSMAVRRVERILGLANPKVELAEFQAAFAREAEADLFRICLRRERAGLDQFFTNLRAGALPTADYLAMVGGGGRPPAAGAAARLNELAYRPHLPGDHATYLELTTAVLEALNLPEHEQRPALNAIPAPPKAPGSMFSHFLFPHLAKLHTASLRAKAQLRCAAVGLAVERFRREHGRWPETLTEVPTALLSTIPPDPFDGQPLRYVRRPDGVTVYSIGPNEKDDRGTISDGQSPPDAPVDIGFRLYNPDQRGLPPLPRPGAAQPAEEPGEDAGGDAATEPLPYPREVPNR